ncbi:hypothetical protein [Streptomyces sp. ST1015]|uniref:hypothetical protein n=1 Tax=Streptomyces sp. ST1015 TaxID=1848900 RepID=UPI001CA760F4|nr:hypothetical protein [Streptomyces sp. ST1015]QZZ25095.1 hypothetical protein A7X85_01190 [Streptomyces sp. ST1015]
MGTQLRLTADEHGEVRAALALTSPHPVVLARLAATAPRTRPVRTAQPSRRPA